MEQIPLIILSLFFTCTALCIILFMAWRAFGEQRHVLTWSLVFAVLAAQFLSDIAWSYNRFNNPYLHWALQVFLGILAPVLGVAGYRQRLEKHVYLPLQSSVVIAVCGVSGWFTFEQSQPAISASVLPFVSGLIFLWTAWIVYDVPREKRSIEWGSIVSYFGIGLLAIAAAAAVFLNHANPDPAQAALYQILLYLMLPAVVIVVGLLMLSIVAADLAKQAQGLAEYQEIKRREDTEKTWGTLQDAIEAIPDVVAIDDGKGIIVTCNEAFALLLKRTKQDIIGKRTIELIEIYKERFLNVDGEDIDGSQHILQKFAHALTTGARIDIVTRENKNYIIDIASLRSGGQIMIARDVTPLFHARNRLEAAINSLPIGFAFYDQNDQLVACNHNFEKVHQKDTAWIAAQPIEKLTSNIMRRITALKEASLLERSAWLHDVIRSIENRQSSNYIGKFDDDNWYELVIEPVAGGGFVALASDITNRRLLELDMERNEAKLREILGSQPFPVVVVNKKDLRILFASRAATAVLAHVNDDLVGYTAQRFLLENRLTEEDALIAATGDDKLHEVTLIRKDGNQFPALLSGQDIQYAGDAARVVSFIDISNIHELTSELATQRQALFQSEKLNALGTLLAGVAHELNNPLTVVVANAHVLGMTTKDIAMQARIEKIINAADRCSKIVRSFLDMARKSPGETVSFDVLNCIKQALEITSFGIQEHNVLLETDLPDALPAIVGDPDQFSQAIINLIINAQQALTKQEHPRSIHVAACLSVSGKAIEIHVQDNGPGIPEDIRGRVFEPFFSTKKVGEGTGMGLSLVRSIVQAQGGDITLSADTSAGAHFIISMPHNGQMTTADTSKATNSKKTVSHRLRVLIVDDEPDVLEVVGDILVLAGHDPEGVSSGTAALQALSQTSFDCILSDLRMPDMDGAQLFEAIKEQYPDMEKRTAFITGNNLSTQTRSFLDGCGRPSLGKPFLPEDLQALLQILTEI